MPVIQYGSLNTTALIVPDIYVQVVPPQVLQLNGVPTNIIGVVGTASWGPVGSPAIVSNMSDYARVFGPIVNRKYDAGTQVATAVLQGAQNFRVVRVTDGTDIAATSTGVSGSITFSSIYTGSLGNNIVVSISTGSKSGSWKVTVAIPGVIPEVFDNITGTGNSFWVNMAAAINGGSGVLRGASQIITAAAGAGTTSPVAGTYTFSGGSDGTTSINTATLIGLDTVPRRGMYALRGQNCSVGVLADSDDSTQWTVQASFGLSEGIYMICTSPAGDTIANAISTKATAGLDSYSVKLMFGDWLWWNDPVNGVIRLVSPQGFTAGRISNLSPEQSSLNKPLFGVIGSQKSGLTAGQATTYSAAELQSLFQVGIDVIANPQPAGSFWGVRAGHNSSSNAAINGDNYTRMTNYLASTLNSGMGQYVGRLININLFAQIRSTLLSFLSGLLSQGMLGTTNGLLPFSVICDTSNNPQSRTALGYVQADVQVQYQAINERFIVNLEGGQTVQVLRQNTQTNPTGFSTSPI